MAVKHPAGTALPSFGMICALRQFPRAASCGAVRNPKIGNVRFLGRLGSRPLFRGDKKMKRNAIAGAVVSALGLLAGSEVQAAAFALYEQGVSGLGSAYAGAAAAAEDATTVWWNPAGMARLGSGKHFAIAGSIIAPSTKFSDSGSAAAGGRPLGGNGGDAGSTAFVPSMFFAMQYDPRWNFGVGVSVPFGLKTEYESTWIGRFQGISSKVETLNINPSVSYKFSDAASVGFGLSYQR